MDYKHRRRCAVCRSPYRKEIDQLLYDGVTKTEIMRQYPNEGLNFPNLRKHEEIFFVDIRNQAVAEYTNSPEAQDRIKTHVSEIDALDDLRHKLHSYIMNEDFTHIAPRKLEVVGDLLIRSITAKAEILSTIQTNANDPLKIITDLINDESLMQIDAYSAPELGNSAPLSCRYWQKESEFCYVCTNKDTEYPGFSDTVDCCPKSAFCLNWADNSSEQTILPKSIDELEDG